MEIKSPHGVFQLKVEVPFPAHCLVYKADPGCDSELADVLYDSRGIQAALVDRADDKGPVDS